MDLVPWKPFGGLNPFRGEMDSLWDKFFRERSLVRAFGEEWSPSVDISETEDKLLIKAELPGLEAKDVNVSISGDLLTIKGEKKKEKEEKDEQHHYIEGYEMNFSLIPIAHYPEFERGQRVILEMERVKWPRLFLNFQMKT